MRTANSLGCTAKENEVQGINEEIAVMQSMGNAFRVYMNAIIESCKENASEYWSKESLHWFRTNCHQYIDKITDEALAQYENLDLSVREKLEYEELHRNDSMEMVRTWPGEE